LVDRLRWPIDIPTLEFDIFFQDFLDRTPALTSGDLSIK
jgi:hypothetical protein